MSPTSSEPDDFVTVRSLLPTLPLPTNNERPAVTTDRLIIRALQHTDLEAFYALRTEQDVMKWTSAGRIDRDVEETQGKLNLFLSPNDTVTFNCAICLKDTGEFIGIGGCHLFPAEHGWPEVGYMLRKAFWGRGLASEFLSAWLRMWSDLPRAELESRVQREMVAGEAGVDEHLIAITEESNLPSQKVLLRAGFERFRVWTDGNEDDAKGVVKLVAFRFFPSRHRDSIQEIDRMIG
jgi:RimJ/RimL family protein N-acetyltransferase